MPPGKPTSAASATAPQASIRRVRRPESRRGTARPPVREGRRRRAPDERGGPTPARPASLPGMHALDPEAAEVKAAGGVVWRRGAGGRRVVVVHRPRYDDWSLPKGKLDPGETLGGGRAARGRGGDRAALPARRRAPAGAYRDHKGRAKVVRYWLMEPGGRREFAPNDEVDEMRWVDAGDGRRRC